MGLNILENKMHPLTAGEKRVLEALKNLYKEVEHAVYIYVQPNLGDKRPDFIVIDQHSGVCVIEVKDWSESTISDVSISNATVLGEVYQNPVTQVTHYVDAIKWSISQKNSTLVDSECVNRVIAFVNMPTTTRVNPHLKQLFKRNIQYLFKTDLKDLTTNNLFSEDKEDLSTEGVQLLRITIFPEIGLESPEIVKTQRSDIKALDTEQESYAKQLPYGHYMVTGIPGSGKTVILLTRAIHLIQEHPDWKILIVTYNKALRIKLENRLNDYAKLFADDETKSELNFHHIEVKHFHGLLKELTKSERWPNPRPDNWFEVGWVDMASQYAHPTYQAILVDEYQDFYKKWIELCLKLCIPFKSKKTESIVKNIYLVGDRLQSIYNEDEVSWKEIGINMQGRSKFLKTAYRSTQEHLNLALEYLKSNPTLKKEIEKNYQTSDNELTANSNGQVEFKTLNLKAIGDEINKLKKEGYLNEDFLILVGTNKQAQTIVSENGRKLNYDIIQFEANNTHQLQGKVLVTTVHSSKGLEAKVVFLVNPDYIFNKSDQIKRKLLYVAMTRASEKLCICREPRASHDVFSELEKLHKQLHH